MRIALFRPDLPPNVGAIPRLGACLGLRVDIIKPCGFPIGRAAPRRGAMDCFDHVDLTIHADRAAFQQNAPGRRVLLTTKAATSHLEATCIAGDVPIAGQESTGAPDFVHDAAISVSAFRCGPVCGRSMSRSPPPW